LRSRCPAANRAALLEAVRERPGASAGELGAAAGISRPVAYTLLNRLTEGGELVRGELSGGTSGYSLPPEPSAAGWSGGDGGADTRRAQDATASSGTEPTTA
jgi:hypothetical protein